MKRREQIERALEFAVKYGSIDGAHHKDWVIDQMVRALTGCPVVKGGSRDEYGLAYEWVDQGESEEYKTLVREASDGEDGPDTYGWDVGIAP